MASTGEAVWRLGRRPALDGLRGIAILLVLADHCLSSSFLAGGSVGVTLFFTLSGFLITTLLLEERAETGRINLRRFYERRARRLLPALLVFVAVALTLALVLGDRFATVGSAAKVLLYVGNFPLAAGGEANAFGHTWSLAIEEQFYLLWPLVLIVCRSRRAVLWGAGVGAAVVVLWRLDLWVHGASAARVYYGTDARCDALLVGCALAAVLHGRTTWRARPVTAVLALVGMVAAGFFGLDGGMYVVVPTVVPLLACVAIVAATGEGAPSFLRVGWLRLVGQRSYGLYLWHYPVLWLGTALVPGPRLVVVPLLVAASLLLTEVSWRYVEEPVLSHRRGAGSRRADHRDLLNRLIPAR